MSKFGCQCGETISMVEYPNLIEGSLYGIAAREVFEHEIEKALAEYLAGPSDAAKQRWLETFFSKDYPPRLADAEVAVNIVTKAMDPYLRDVIECPSCRRLHVQVVPGENRYRSYLPEQGTSGGIFEVNKRA